jgi:CBS-domain-containing membrane protein
MTTNFASINPRSNLSGMVQRIVDTGANNLVVLDKFDRPAGIVSATDVLSAVVERIPDRAKTKTRRITAQKPR